MHDEGKTCIKECKGVIKELPKSNDLEAIVTLSLPTGLRKLLTLGISGVFSSGNSQDRH
jgi:hypothetical protein